MTLPTAASTTLLTEHFQWTPLSLIDDIINTANELLYSTVAGVADFFQSVSPPDIGFHPPPGVIPDTDGDGNILYSAAERDEIEKGIHSLETLFEHAVDRNFDGFELFVLRNIFVVKEELVAWVRLQHHQGIEFLGHGKDVPTAEEAARRLRELRQTLLATVALNESLKSEKAANERTIKQLRALVAATQTGPSNDTEAGRSAFALLQSSKDARNSFDFATSQMSLIRNLVDEIKPKWTELKTLRAANRDKMDVDSASSGSLLLGGGDAEDQRKRYIDVLTRKFIETQRGQQLGPNGEVEGGEYDPPDGVKRSAEEVRALGDIAEALRAGRWNIGEGSSMKGKGKASSEGSSRGVGKVESSSEETDRMDIAKTEDITKVEDEAKAEDVAKMEEEEDGSDEPAAKVEGGSGGDAGGAS